MTTTCFTTDKPSAAADHPRSQISGGATAVDTIRRWPSVRRGEERWIFPFQENADAMFNSSLLFELGVIREEADGVLAGVPRATYRSMPRLCG